MPMAPRLRADPDDDAAYCLYEIFPEFFTVKLYHDGQFIRKPLRVYKGGVFDYFDFCEVDNFSLHEVNKMLEELGIVGMFFYFYRVPHMDLDNGLCPLQCDSDVVGFLQFAETNFEIEVYLSDNITGDVIDRMLVPRYTHGKSGVMIEELDNEDNEDNIVEENLKKDCLNVERLSDRETSTDGEDSENSREAINEEHISVGGKDDIQRGDDVGEEEAFVGLENGSVDAGVKGFVAGGVEKSFVPAGGVGKRFVAACERGLIPVKKKRWLVNKELLPNKRMLMIC